MILKIAKWILCVAVVVTAVLVAVDTPVGIGLMAIDAIGGVVYGMYKSSCDRRQLHHITVIHRI